MREDVEWLGWKPVRTTFTSDYFDKLYELAIELIKKGTTHSLIYLLTHSFVYLHTGKAYVCHQSKADIEASREICRKKLEDPTFDGNQNSPWRDRPIEESLQEFQNMRKGLYGGSEATLRMKMDMTSPNPNMYSLTLTYSRTHSLTRMLVGGIKLHIALSTCHIHTQGINGVFILLMTTLTVSLIVWNILTILSALWSLKQEESHTFGY